MTKSTLKCVQICSLLGLAGALLAGCEKPEPKQTEKPVALDAGTSKVADEPALAQAVAIAASGGESAAGGPPPNGIFEPGAADKALAKGAPAIITLGSEGAAPRVQLGSLPKPGSKRSGSIEVATQSDPQQGAIPISLAVSLEAQRSKADAGATAPIQMLARITGATINAPGVPAEVTAGVAKLKGSRVEYLLSPDGAASDFHAEIARGVDPAFKEAVQSLSDALTVLSLPFPSKPIGVGGFWLVTTRDTLSGLDVVTYRMVKVSAVDAHSATLSLNVKRYAASTAFDVQGLPPDAPHVMSDFHDVTQGSLVFDAGDSTPKSGQLDSALTVGLGQADPVTKQRASLQLQSRAIVAF